MKTNAKAANKLYVGDNLKCLISLPANSADVIYTDPPYNTGGSFSYRDKRSSWCSFMGSRLQYARRALKPSGAIFISIDDNKLYELKLLCDKVFGEDNFLGNFITGQGIHNNSLYINTMHEYVLAYAKDKKNLKPFRCKRMDSSEGKIIKPIIDKVRAEFKRSGKEKAKALLKELCAKSGESWLRAYDQVDERGRIYTVDTLMVPGNPSALEVPELGLSLPEHPTRGWVSKDHLLKLHKERKLIIKNGRPYRKSYLDESMATAKSLLNYQSADGTRDLKSLGLTGLFDTPKPVGLIKYLISLVADKGVVFDPFGGSGTTAQAVMELNKEGSDLSFILCQLNEKISVGSKQYKYAKEHNLGNTIDKLTVHRIQVAAEKLDYPLDLKVIEL